MVMHGFIAKCKQQKKKLDSQTKKAKLGRIMSIQIGWKLLAVRLLILRVVMILLLVSI